MLPLSGDLAMNEYAPKNAVVIPVSYPQASIVKTIAQVVSRTITAVEAHRR